MYSPERTRSTATGLRCAFRRKRSSGRRRRTSASTRGPQLARIDSETPTTSQPPATERSPTTASAQLREQRPRALEQSLRGLRQAHAAPGALAQARAELRFERVDALGHRGLRDAQARRRAAHGAVLGERGQGFELVDHERFPIGLDPVKSILFSPHRRRPILPAAGGCMDGLATLITFVAFATSVISAVFGMAGGMILMGVYAAHPAGAGRDGPARRDAAVRERLPRVPAARADLHRRASSGTAWARSPRSRSSPGSRWWWRGRVLFLLLGGDPARALAPAAAAGRRSFEQRPAPRSPAGRSCTAARASCRACPGPLLDVFFVRAELDRFEVIATKAFTQVVGHVMKILYFAWLVRGAAARA